MRVSCDELGALVRLAPPDCVSHPPPSNTTGLAFWSAGRRATLTCRPDETGQPRYRLLPALGLPGRAGEIAKRRPYGQTGRLITACRVDLAGFEWGGHKLYKLM